MTNNFDRLWALGYERLVPIIPPTASISERSSLFSRVGTPQDGRGKTPGVQGRDGNWFGFDWVPHEADAHDLSRWAAMGAGTGIKAGRGLIAIDADTLNAAFAEIIRDTITAQLGQLPVRVGQYPKALYLCRVDGPFQYQRIEFGPRDDKGNAERVEILSDGRQFVAEGIHPKTRQPYTWPKPIIPFDELPVFTPQQIEDVLQALAQSLPEASKAIKEGATTEIAQEALRGSPEHIRKAVSAIPNTSASFPTRESYRDFGYAIKAALPDDPEDAFEIFAEWCERWQEGDNDPGVVEADWRRMKPPFRRGAGWLYEMAEQTSPDKFSKTEIWFEQPAESNSPFGPENLPNAFENKGDIYPLLTIEDLVGRPAPTYLIDRHIPDISVGFLYGAPGAKKSFIALDIGLSIAHQLETWHGDLINADDDSVVVYIASEGSFDLRNRIQAWLRTRGIEKSSKRFLVIERTINFLSPEDVDRLLRTVASVGAKPCFVVVDTVSRSMPGADENLQKDMTLFVKACDRVRDQFRCAVLGVHHSNKVGDSMRGSSVLQGAGDFVFRMECKKGATIGTLTCEKQKAAPDGWDEPYRFDLVQLGDGQSSLVPARADLSIGPDVALTPDTSARVLGAMRAAWEDGEPWSKAPQAKERFAVRRMVFDFGFRAQQAEELLSMWEASGFIKVETVSAKRRLVGLKVVGEIPDNLSPNEGVFG